MSECSAVTKGSTSWAIFDYQVTDAVLPEMQSAASPLEPDPEKEPEPELEKEPEPKLDLPVYFAFDPRNTETVLDTIIYKVGDRR